MTITPVEWNVVVAGYWNRAIFTPMGISKRLFKLEESTMISVEVPMDGISPYKVSHDGITVIPDSSRLIVLPVVSDFKQLARAMEIASVAISELPETPFSAVGLNVKYHIANPEASLLALLKCDIDGAISDAGFTITSRDVRRSVAFNGGVINIHCAMGEDESIAKIELNYHRETTVADDLKAWLSMPADDIGRSVDKILGGVFGVDVKEASSV